MTEWYDYQKDYINSLDVTTFTEGPIYKDRASISEVIVYKKKVLLGKDVEISLYGDRIEVKNGEEILLLPFSEVSSAAVLGRNKLNVYHNGRVYQFKGAKRFNALKYVNIYFRYKNITKGDIDGKFLGL